MKTPAAHGDAADRGYMLQDLADARKRIDALTAQLAAAERAIEACEYLLLLAIIGWAASVASLVKP